MSGPDPRWRERCEMYFSSMDKFANQDVKGENNKSKARWKNEGRFTDKNGTPREEIVRFPDYRRNITTFSKKKQPFKGIIRWLSSVDLHGTSMLPRARSHVFCAFWMIVTIIGCVLFAVGSYKYIKDYIDEDHDIKTDTVGDGNNASPLSLTVCNNNIIRRSKIVSGTRFFGLESLNLTHLGTKGVIRSTGKQSVENLLANTDLLLFLQENDLADLSTEVLADINKEYTSYGAMITDSDWENVGRSLLNIDSNPFTRAFRLSSPELREFGHDMETSILRCTKNGRACDSAEISYVQNAELGNCAVIYLSLEDSWFDTLALTLDVQADDYLDIVSPAPGIRAVVQSSFSTSSLPIHSHDSFTANPGEGLHIIASKTHELKRRNKNCDKDPNYNRLECLSRCLELRTAELCRCSISLQSQLSMRCHVNLQYEYVCQRLLQVLYQRNKLPCNCPHLCKEESITVSASTFNWIKDESKALLVASLEASGKSSNVSSLRESVTKIKVSWSHSSYVTLEADDKLSLMGLFLKLGALSAITVGISVVTILELLWLIGRAFVVLCCAVANRERDDNTVHQINPVQDVYPDFDNIAHNWYAIDANGVVKGHHATEPALGLADSPLNRRPINNYIIAPHHAEYHEPSTRGHRDFIYRGQARDSGFVYGDFSGDKELSPILDNPESPDLNNPKRREENELFHQPWDKSGQFGVYSRVVIPNPNPTEKKEVPLFNSPFMTVGEDYSPAANKTIDKSQDVDDEGFSFNQIIKSLQNSNNSKPGSGEQSKTESQRQADCYRPTSNNEVTVEENDNNNADKKKADNDGNIFKISEADIHDASWIPEEEMTKTKGPDLSRLDRLFYTSTHRPVKDTSPNKAYHYQHRQSHSRNVRGFGRSHSNKVERIMNETTPVRSSGGLQRTQLISPNTWHYYSEGNHSPLMVPAAYMAPSYDGRTTVFRPQGSNYFQPGGAGIVNQEGGQSYYLHS